jgi:hypothetical protein
MKYLILIIATIGLFSCSNNSNENESEQETNGVDSIEITWVEVADTMSSFEALLSTNHLYYLEHMSFDYDNYGTDFWKSTDTIKNNNWVLTRFRKGACKNVSDTSQAELCMEKQEHTINKIIGKVVKFSGSGSGYFATIEYVYDESGRLLEYKDFDKTFYLKYDDKNQLKQVLRTEINHGIKIETGLIKFKKLPTTVAKKS